MLKQKILSRNLNKIESYLDKVVESTSKVTLSRTQLKILNETLMRICLKIFWQKPLTAKFVIYLFWQELGNQVKLSPNSKTLSQASLKQFLRLLKEKKAKGEEPHFTTLKTAASPADKRLKHLEDTKSDIEKSIKDLEHDVEDKDTEPEDKIGLEKMLNDFKKKLQQITFMIDHFEERVA